MDFFGDYEFPVPSKNGTKIKETLDKVVLDYFGLFCWTHDQKRPGESEWRGLDDKHQDAFMKIVYQIVYEQPLTIPKSESDYGEIVIHFKHRELCDDENMKNREHIFLIKAGSAIRKEVVKSIDKDYGWIRERREKMMKENTLVNCPTNDEALILKEDHPLKVAPTGLAAFIFGGSRSGPDHIDFGTKDEKWKFGSESDARKKLNSEKEKELPDSNTLIGWLMHPDLAKYGRISVDDDGI